MAPSAATARRLPPDPGPPATGPDPDRKLTLALPFSVLRQLRARTAEGDTTVRALVLEALRGAGYEVPAAEIRDRRRRHSGDGQGGGARDGREGGQRP